MLTLQTEDEIAQDLYLMSVKDVNWALRFEENIVKYFLTDQIVAC